MNLKFVFRSGPPARRCWRGIPGSQTLVCAKHQNQHQLCCNLPRKIFLRRLRSCLNSVRMLRLCCNPFMHRHKHQVRDNPFDDPAPRLYPVELRPTERSLNCYHPDARCRLPRSGTVRLPRSLTTPWLLQNASTKDVVKSSQTQKNLASTTQDRQNSMRDKKV